MRVLVRRGDYQLDRQRKREYVRKLDKKARVRASSRIESRVRLSWALLRAFSLLEGRIRASLGMVSRQRESALMEARLRVS